MTENERDLQMDAWLERLVTAFERIAGSLEKIANPPMMVGTGPFIVTSVIPGDGGGN